MRTFLAAAICFGVVAASPAAGQRISVKNIYVEPFPAKTGSTKLRDDLIEQLRKLGTLSIVTSEFAADAIVSGDGETWIKGYRSLNPRSGRLPSDGEPVYAGFLSVELKSVKGETLWSYLVTLGPASESISKDLSKQIVKHLVDALNTGSLK
jgi:hypothetical protein